MKITNSQIIKAGEKELIDTIIDDLDWDVIKEMFREKLDLQIQDDVEYRRGDIVVYDNQIAYQLDFDVQATLSVLFDRAGNHLAFNTSVSGGDSSSDTSSVSNDETLPEDASSADIPADVPEDLDISGLMESEESSSPVKTDNPTVDETPADVADDLDISGILESTESSPQVPSNKLPAEGIAADAADDLDISDLLEAAES